MPLSVHVSRIVWMFAGLIVAAHVCSGEPLPARAIERYKQVLAGNPVDGIVLDRLWKAYVDAGQTADLLAEYKAGESFAAKMVLGHLLRRAGQFDGAVSAFEAAARLNAASTLPSLSLAALHDALGRPRDAAESLKKALALWPNDDPGRAEILIRLGEKWLAAGEMEKAAEAWEQTIVRDPANIELRQRLAETYAQHHLGERAVYHLEYLALNASPSERALALQQLARIHEGADRPDEAIAALERGLALTAQGNWLRTELQSQLIRLHQRHHRTAELEARWKERAAEHPRDAAALLQLVDLFERVGDLDQERAWLERLVALLPKSAEHRLHLARVYVRLDHTDAAAALYDKLLQESPTHPDLVFERARIDIEREVPSAARQRITALLAQKKNDDSVRARALEFFEANRLHDAVEEHLKADAAAGGDEPLLALARFYFAQRREGDAQRTLDRMIRKEATPSAQAAAHVRVAELLKSQGDIPSAIAAVKSAIALLPDGRENHLLIGELETARGGYAAAQTAFEKAFSLSTIPTEALDADQKLFDSVRSQTGRQDQKGGDGRPFSGASRGDEGQSISTPALQNVILSLTRVAAARPTVDGWLRVARWHLWSRNPRVAQECAQQALTLDPRSVAANEFMVKLATVDPQPQRAISFLRELMKIDAGGRAGYERRIAQIELQSGRSEEALMLFRELADAAPGNIDALNDLAMAQQRAERWPEALATSCQILALSPGSRKKEAISQLQRVYERLRMPIEAAALLLQQIDAETEEKERFNLFHDLLAHCIKHGQLDWLREQFQARRKLQADDYFANVALGRVLKAAGEKAAAFDLFAIAALAAPNPAEALPELVREAEELRKLEAAVQLQEHLVKITPQPPAEAQEKLAQLQERNFDITAAAQTWAKITAKFPRDATVLQHAADFELKWGTPARSLELLRKTRELEPANLRTLAILADLELDSGKTAEAEKWFEEILRLAPPEKPGTIRFPAWKPEDPGRLQSSYLDTVRLRRGRPNTEAMRALRSFWVTDQPAIKNDSDLRLNAIRQLANLIRAKGDAAAVERWTERWRKVSGAPSETLWALYYCGAHTALLDHLEKLMARAESEAQTKQAFLWLALQTREFDRLSTWLRDKRRTAADRDFLLVAIGQHLNASGGPVDSTMIERLFPPGFRLRLWQAAQMFANRGQFREAAQLGRRVFEGLSTQRAGYGIDLATWNLYLGDVDTARRILRASIDTRGETFEAPVYSALRQYWLLLPASERTGFADTFLAGLDEQKEPLHAAICGALLHGLGGHELLAKEQLRRVLAFGAMSHLSFEEPGNSASRVWEFILNGGAQLQSWKLDNLAIFFWENALADPALIRLQTQAQGEQVQTRSFEVRTRLAALKIVRADPFEREEMVTNYKRYSLHDGLVPLGEALESIGAYSRSIEISRQLWELEPTNPHALRNVISACRTGGDVETLEQVVGRCVREGIFRSTEAAHRDLALQLVELLEKRGAISEARQILAETLDNPSSTAGERRASNDSRLLLRLGQLYERTGQAERAEGVYRRILSFEPGNTVAQIALAVLLEAHGNIADAVTILEKSTGVEVETKLADLYLKMGRRQEALSALERLPAGSHIAAALGFADTLISRNERREALIVLRNEAGRSPDPRANFPLQAKIIELLSPNEERPLIAREWRRLRQIAADDRNLLSAYFDLLLRESGRLHSENDALRELKEDWDDGEGALAAGAALLEWELRRGEFTSGQNIGAQLLARNDLTEQTAQRIAAIATQSGRLDLAIQAKARCARLNPLDYSKTIDWAQALYQRGRRAEAIAALDALTWHAALNEEIAAGVAEAFFTFGEFSRSRDLFQQAVAGDSTARNYRAFLGLARLHLAEGDSATAKKMLQMAFRNPANREFGELCAYLGAAGRFGTADRALAELELTPAQMLGARRGLFIHWHQRGALENALSVLEEHPEVIDMELLRKLHELTKLAGDFERAARLLEQLQMESPALRMDLGRELAILYGDWAAADLQRLQSGSALVHLKRGHELLPEHFAIARQLSELYLQRGESKAATETLERFLASSKNAGEKETARQLLAKIHPS